MGDAVLEIVSSDFLFKEYPNLPEINEDTNFVEDLGADSLDLYQIVMEVEEGLGIEVDAESIAKVSTYGEALEMLQEYE